jgi:hypothetical protein
METPLIQQIDKNTLITFPSALEDFEINGFVDSSKTVHFSHFALLNIPDITISSNRANKIDVLRNESVGLTGLNSGSGSIGDRLDLSESLQNYLLNAESLLTEAPHYNKSLLSNSSEQIFWKWLNDVGGIRYRKADNNESLVTTSFVEEDDNIDLSKPLYDRVVKYVGGIGLQSNTKGRKNSFREVYILVPSDCGSTPTVLFESVADANYYPYLIWQKETDQEFINGYSSESDMPPTGLDLIAQYDNDSNGIEYETTDKFGNTTNSHWSDYNLTPNTYCTEKEFGIADNEVLVRTNPDTSTKEIYRSRLDGVRLDLNFSNYTANTANISTFDSYNKNIRAKSFQYNAMLIYYTVKDNATGAIATNLYGVSFLGDVEEYSAGTSRIIRTNKVKNDTNTSTTGNAFGYRYNFKLSARQENITPQIEVDVAPENNFSMMMFSSLMASTQEIIKNYEESIELNRTLLDANRDLVLQLSDLNNDELVAKYDELILLFQNYNINDANGNLIADLQNQINKIVSGNTSVTVDVLMDVTGKGGIITDYDKEKNLLTISDSKKEFSEVEKLEIDTLPNNMNVSKVGTSKKLLLLKSTSVLDSQINLRLDDSINWDLGQTVEVVGDSFLIGNTTLNIYTDAGALVASSAYGLLIYSNNIKAEQTIKITCIDKKNMEFLIR